MNKKVCCICGYPIDESHNPAPLKKDGVCCSYCNNHLVIPTRLGAKIYICTEDILCDDFCVGVIDTIEGWRNKAIKWASDREDKVKELKNLPQEKVINYVENIGQIVLEEYKYE